MTVYRIKITDKRTMRVLVDDDFEAESDTPTFVFATAWMLSGASLDPADFENYEAETTLVSAVSAYPPS